MIVMFCDVTQTNDEQTIMHPEINKILLLNSQEGCQDTYRSKGGEESW